MVKLPAITPKNLIKILERIGFEIKRISGSHVILRRASDNRRVIVPCHAKDLPKGTLLAILDEAGISKEQFQNLL